MVKGANPKNRQSWSRRIVIIALPVMLLASCADGDTDLVETQPTHDEEPQPTQGDAVLREQWAALIDDVDERDVTPTVIGLHALLDTRLPIIDIDPATGPWTVTRTANQPALRCHADAALTAIVALRQHDASGQAALGPELFVSVQTDIADMAPSSGWVLTSSQQFSAGHPAYEDGVRGTIFRLEGHGDVWLVTVSHEPDVVTTINYCPADLNPLPEAPDAHEAAAQARKAITVGNYTEATRLVERALAADPTNRELHILAYAQHGDQMLHVAFWDGDEEAVATLAQIVPDIDQRDERFESSTLVLAAAWGKTDMVRILLDAGADPNAGADKDGLTALMWAAKNFDEQLDMARMLLQAGADVHARSAYDETALNIAEDYQNPNIVALLGEYGATD